MRFMALAVSVVTCALVLSVLLEACGGRSTVDVGGSTSDVPVVATSEGGTAGSTGGVPSVGGTSNGGTGGGTVGGVPSVGGTGEGGTGGTTSGAPSVVSTSSGGTAGSMGGAPPSGAAGSSMNNSAGTLAGPECNYEGTHYALGASWQVGCEICSCGYNRISCFPGGCSGSSPGPMR